MHILTTLGIAVALAMDAFAVAIATGVSLKQVSVRQTFRLSWHFGLFQALMPVIGWGLGASIEQLRGCLCPLGGLHHARSGRFQYAERSHPDR